jgi:hypothetical protein
VARTPASYPGSPAPDLHPCGRIHVAYATRTCPTHSLRRWNKFVSQVRHEFVQRSGVAKGGHLPARLAKHGAGDTPAGRYGAGTIAVWNRDHQQCHEWTAAVIRCSLHGECVTCRHQHDRTQPRF